MILGFSLVGTFPFSLTLVPDYSRSDHFPNTVKVKRTQKNFLPNSEQRPV